MNKFQRLRLSLMTVLSLSDRNGMSMITAWPFIVMAAKKYQIHLIKVFKNYSCYILVKNYLVKNIEKYYHHSYIFII